LGGVFDRGPSDGKERRRDIDPIPFQPSRGRANFGALIRSAALFGIENTHPIGLSTIVPVPSVNPVTMQSARRSSAGPEPTGESTPNAGLSSFGISFALLIDESLGG
jgi:hypothetical protein